MSRTNWKKIFDDNRERFIDEWSLFLSYPSISTDPKHSQDCEDCAKWLTEHLATLGLQSETLATTGKSVVYGKVAGQQQKTALFYGHYDVQPVDPLELWETDPFKPELRDGRLYARGAQDNKGQLFAFVKALEMLVAKNALGPSIKVLIEGEEECGSVALTEALPAWKERLASEQLLVSDSGTRAAGLGTICMGLKGLVSCTVTLKGASKDLHSGYHGSLAPNPALQIARLVATLHGEDGRIMIDGFYDSLHEASKRERDLANKCFLNASEYEKLVGVKPVAGESGFSLAERFGFRPTIDINGIHSGYDGPGVKTVLPSYASCKLSARLVAGQDPEVTLKLIVKHLQKHKPDGLALEISEEEIGGPALLLNLDGPGIARAAKTLKELTGQEVDYSWIGASIPIVSALAEVSGAEAVLAGFGLEEDNIHAPNESFMLSQFEQCFLYYCKLLENDQY
jgi:acetylornithine deacetylase/succinyl-diaminopimelate desuccinylase-like protein